MLHIPLGLLRADRTAFALLDPPLRLGKRALDHLLTLDIPRRARASGSDEPAADSRPLLLKLSGPLGADAGRRCVWEVRDLLAGDDQLRETRDSEPIDARDCRDDLLLVAVAVATEALQVLEQCVLAPLELGVVDQLAPSDHAVGRMKSSAPE